MTISAAELKLSFAFAASGSAGTFANCRAVPAAASLAYVVTDEFNSLIR